MKKIEDLSRDKNIKINLSPDTRIKKVEVLGEKQEIIQDLTSTDPLKGDIEFLSQKKIFLTEKKKQKSFDALEKKKLPFWKKTLVFSRNKFFIKRVKSEGVFSFSKGKMPQLPHLSKRKYQLLFLLLFLCFLGIISGNVIENRVRAGYEKMMDIREGNMGFEEIQKNLNNARFDLLLSDILFYPFSFFGGEKTESIKHIISGGRYLSESLDNLLALYGKVSLFLDKKNIGTVYFTQLFSNMYPELLEIEASLKKAETSYRNITWLPSKDLEEKRKGNLIKIEKIESYLTTLNKNFPTFLDILGNSKKQRYLIVFQNADEIRPTGGFMGSMAIIEIYKGRVELFQKKDVYAIEWDLKKADYERLPAPKGINELTETFGLRDSNYFVNLGKSAETIDFFVENAGIDIDGILFLNQHVIRRLLEITGPVYFDDLKMNISSENFSEVFSVLVESKIFKEGSTGTPKQILFDFVEVFQRELVKKGAYFDYLQSILHDFESHEIMMWSFDPKHNALLETLGMNGQELSASTLDFVYPVSTSLSGNKSDRYIERSYTHEVRNEANCSIRVLHTLQSNHIFTQKKREELTNFMQQYDVYSPEALIIQGAGTNRQFMRVFIPKNVDVTPQDGLEVFEEDQWTRLEFFVDTKPLETSFYTFEYRFENPDCTNYSFSFYKQSGIPEYDITIKGPKQSYEFLKRRENFYFEKREDF